MGCAARTCRGIIKNRTADNVERSSSGVVGCAAVGRGVAGEDEIVERQRAAAVIDAAAACGADGACAVSAGYAQVADGCDRAGIIGKNTTEVVAADG